MKRRIALWAGVGFLIAGFWALFLFPSAAMMPEQVLTISRLTCPIVFAAPHSAHHFYWVLLSNTAIYALVGLIAESMRHKFQHA